MESKGMTERAVGISRQDTYSQAEFAEIMEDFKFNENYQYIMDVHADTGIKFSSLAARPICEKPMDQNEFFLFMGNLDIEQGQYRITAKAGKIEIQRINKRWIQREDIK